MLSLTTDFNGDKEQVKTREPSRRPMFHFLAAVVSAVLANSLACGCANAGGNGSARAGASGNEKLLTLPNQEKWRVSLETACVDAAHRNRPPVASFEKGCACIVRNVLGLAVREPSVKIAEKDLSWIKKYYEGKMSQEEFEKDPLYLADHLIAFGNQCLENSDYVHKFDR